MTSSIIQALILDMDGVLWTGDAPIGDLPAIFTRLRANEIAFALATNNSLRTPSQYVSRLYDLGVAVEPSRVITSSLAVANILAKSVPAGSEVFVIGETGLIDALKQKQLIPIVDPEYDGIPQAVVVGVDRGISFPKLCRATLLIRRGVPFYATNPDKTFPTPEGLIPGTGALLAALVAATDVNPVIAGKPSTIMIDLAVERLGTPKQTTLMVGDRLETDIAGGQAAGLPVALVLSGVSTRRQGRAWRPEIDFFADSLTALIDFLYN